VRHKLTLAVIVALAFGAIPRDAQAWIISVSGVITSQGGTYEDRLGLFGIVGGPLFGLSYSTTISTDPALNTFANPLTLSYQERYGGESLAAGSGAPYNIVTIVNGVTYSRSELSPFLNRSYLINALSVNDVTTTLQDQIHQDVRSSGCGFSTTPCLESYILAYSLGTPFVPTLDFSVAERVNRT